MSTEQTAPEDFETADYTAPDAAAGEEAEAAPYSPEGRIAAGRSPHGRADRPSLLQKQAQREAYQPEPIRSRMGQAFHERRSLQPTTTISRPDPQERAMADAHRVVTEVGEFKVAGNVGGDGLADNAWGRPDVEDPVTNDLPS